MTRKKAGVPSRFAPFVSDVRVADSDVDHLRAVLAAAGIGADVVAVAATIEERMMVLARETPEAVG